MLRKQRAPFGSFTHWLQRRKQKALAPGALPAGYQDDQRRQELRQQLERELAVILNRLEVFSNQAITLASRGEEFYTLLGELIGRLQDIQAEQAERKQKARPRRLAALVKAKMAAGPAVHPEQGRGDDFSRQIAAVRARPVTRKRAKGLAGLVTKRAGLGELNLMIKQLRAK